MGLVIIHTITETIRSYTKIALLSGAVGFGAGYYIRGKLKSTSTLENYIGNAANVENKVHLDTTKIHNLEQKVLQELGEPLKPDRHFLEKKMLYKPTD